MRAGLRRDLVVGAVAGAVAGVVLAASATQRSGAMLPVGVLPPLPHVLLQFVIAAVGGAGFVALLRPAPAIPAGLSAGMIYGLLWWLLVSLTIAPLASGRMPGWSLVDAATAFPGLISHLLYGALLGAVSSAIAARNPPAALEKEPQGRLPRHVLILGGGFAGISAAQYLEHAVARDPDVRITLVCQSNYLLFTPMLAEVASSGLEAQHITAPIRASLTRTQFRRAEVEGIDLDTRVVRLREGPRGPVEAVGYDHLVLALGSVPNFYDLPGLEAHAFTLKTLADATHLRDHVIGLLERGEAETDPGVRRRLLTFVVAGGGFAGTELVAELRDLCRSVRHLYWRLPTDELRFVLIHSGDRILPELGAGLAQYAQSKLTARGIEVLLGRRVAAAAAGEVRLNDGTTIPTQTLVWTAGNRPHPLLATLPVERNRAGAVIVDATLRVRDRSDLWAVGDCAEVPDVLNPGRPQPPTAQHALRQGAVAGANVAAALRGLPPRPLRFRTIAMLVALGHRTAVAEVRGWKFSGFLAWVLWRLVYLAKLPGLEKKARVALDWSLDLFFPRDVSS